MEIVQAPGRGPESRTRPVYGGAPAVLSILRAIAESSRLRILAVLAHGERSVSEIAEILGQSQPRVSRHLKVLADAGVIDRVSEGAWVFCRLREHPTVMAALDALPPADRAADVPRMAMLDSERSAEAERYFQAHAAEWNSIRSLHVDEAEVEQLLVDAVGEQLFGDLLDIGTGTGRVLSLLASRARRAVGIDQSTAMLAAARPTFAGQDFRHVQLRQGDMNHLPLPAASQDLAIFHQVLHFAAEPSRALAEVARVLRSDGRALVVDFAPHTLQFLREHHAHRRLGFTTDDLIAWSRPHGLSVRELGRRAGTPLTVVLWELRPTVPDSSLT
jgi:ubiquinone/menaquinone biosynthesis C-methylase UbiE